MNRQDELIIIIDNILKNIHDKTCIVYRKDIEKTSNELIGLFKTLQEKTEELNLL